MKTCKLCQVLLDDSLIKNDVCIFCILDKIKKVLDSIDSKLTNLEPRIAEIENKLDDLD